MIWKEGEIVTAIKLVEEGKNYKEISTVLNRNWKSIKEKLSKLGYTSNKYKIDKKIYGNCLECKKDIVSDSESYVKKFCGRSCSTTYNNRIHIKRKATCEQNEFCKNCGLKNTHKYKKFCSFKCQKQFNRKGKLEIGSLHEQTMRKYMIEKHGAKCMECGWDKVNTYLGLCPIHMDHIDGDPRNNKEENVRLLCPSCHSLTPTYGILNKGNGKRIYTYRKLLKNENV